MHLLWPLQRLPSRGLLCLVGSLQGLVLHQVGSLQGHQEGSLQVLAAQSLEEEAVLPLAVVVKMELQPQMVAAWLLELLHAIGAHAINTAEGGAHAINTAEGGAQAINTAEGGAQARNTAEGGI